MTATDELRKKLNKLIIELDGLDATIDSPVSDMTFGEYEQEREKLLDEFIQAIVAMLDSGTCEMEYISDSMRWHCKACDKMDMAPRNPKPRYCKWCGRKVVGE